MEVKFKLLNEHSKLPSYSREGDACMDIRSSEELVLPAGTFKMVGTGVACEVPSGYEMQLRARSGLAAKYGIGVVNGIGTVDENYRGELKFILFNLGKEDFKIEIGDRIGQICFAKTIKIEPTETDTLSDTNRGDKGFESSGRK